MGSAHPLNAPYEAFETTDGWITLGAANQANWLKLVDLIEAPELGDDPRFADNHGRITHRVELAEALAPIIRVRTSADWLARLEAVGVPAGPVLDVAEMHRDPQTLAREMVTEAPHTRLGPVKTLGAPVKFSATPGGVTRGAPLLGEHTREVLAEHGYSEDEVEALIAEGAVVAM
jgi:crotonobetainyl-CoA:carnitine CoA-transferase CaiB-like acyl-CoA transferase